MTRSPADVLGAIPLFQNLGDEESAALVALFRERAYARGAMIVSQGAPGDAMFVIAEGQVKVAVFSEDGREVILSVLGAGGFFGEMALLDDEPRSAHVIAMTDATLLQLRREDFRARLRSSPNLAVALLRELSRRLRRADDTITNMALLDVNGRIAQLLLQLAREEDGVRITRKLTHATIAQMVGASRETVSRTMKTLADRGIISVNRREILLLDPDRLRDGSPRD